MKQHRFIGDFDFSRSEIVSRDLKLINQMKNVLHLSVKEQVVLSTGDNQEVVATVENLNKDEVSFKIVEKRKNQAESGKLVTAYCSILKKENFELVVQKAVECGVKRIIPVISIRTVKTGLKLDRVEKIIKEASEQSGRGVIPELGEITSLPQALESAKENEINLFFDTSGEIFNGKIGEKKIGIFIGPEGGWAAEELVLAKANDCKIVSLGLLTLRGETAAIVASYLAVNS